MEQYGDCHDKNRPTSEVQACTCGNREVVQAHHAPTFALPECWYWFCEECGEEWGQS